MSEKKFPNILFLMSDEHRADVAGFSGDEIVRTPTLDALAQSGVVFENCYTPSPVCVPARQAMMSGQTCKTCQCRNFNSDLTPFYNTFANWLGRYGYYTVVSGKLHHRGKDQMQGWAKRINGDINVELGVDNLLGGRTGKPLSMKWSDAKEVLRAGICEDETFDDDAVNGAVKFIKKYFLDTVHDRPMRDKPILLKVSLLNPHYPYLTKSEQFNYYLNRVKPRLNEEVFDHPYLSTHQVRPNIDANEREITRATAAYYGMIEELDNNYARVMKALEDVGENLDDWLIIYTSDHGEMLGQHGIWEKQNFFEASVKVPLIIRSPKHFTHRKVNENVNTCDLYATLCDYIGIPTPENLDSNSLMPLLQGNSENWNNMTISHFGCYDTLDNHLMIKKDDLKYQYYDKNMPEVLFDLKANPEETINFANDPKYAKEMAEFRSMIDKYQYA